MATITELRPAADLSFAGWSPTPSGDALWEVTSDDNPATYAQWGGTGSNLILSVGTNAPPAGERRHRARVRASGRNGSAYVAVRLPNGTFQAYSSASFPSGGDTHVGSWGFGIPPDAPGTYGVLVSGQTLNIEIRELWVDIDSREAPAFNLDLLDGTGTPSVSITDTSTPSVSINTILADGLPLRQWRAWVEDGSGIVWDSGIVQGSPISTATDPLENGSYTLYAQIWTTLGANTEYASAVESQAFTVNVADVAPPDSVTVTKQVGTPFFDIEVCAPADMSDYDDDEAYVQIQRVDCNGNITLDILGPIGASECVELVDWTAPLSLAENCIDGSEVCSMIWRARFFGDVSGSRVTSAWVRGGTPSP